MERLQELNNSTFQDEKVKARPDIAADPHMDPSYESDENGEDASLSGIHCVLSTSSFYIYIYIYMHSFERLGATSS